MAEEDKAVTGRPAPELNHAVTVALIRKFGMFSDGKLLPRMSSDPPPSDEEIEAHIKKPSAPNDAKG
jgi:hypothetical protein